MQGFTVCNWKTKVVRKPQEDFYKMHKIYPQTNILSVADGITRDCLDGHPVNKSISGLIRTFVAYPRPSPAKEAAKIFCGLTFDYTSLDINEELIKSKFRDANQEIKMFNWEVYPSPDYLVNDFAACVASIAIEKNSEVYYGFIADCGVAILDSKGNLRFKTPNEGPNSKGSIDQDIKTKYNTSFSEPRGRKIIRSEYRNNPKNHLAYGALTGEESAMEYVRIGMLPRDHKDYVLVYSDGLEEIIFNGDKDISGPFVDTLKNNISQLEKFCEKIVKSEGTLIVSQK